MAYARRYGRRGRGRRGGVGRKLRGMDSGTWGYAHPKAGASKKRARTQSDGVGVSSVYNRSRRGAEYSKKKYKSARRGARAKGRDVDRKLLAANVERIVYYFKGMDGDFDGALGHYPLARQLQADNKVHLPMYLINVSAVTNDGVSHPNAFQRFVLDPIAETISLVALNGQNSTGANSTTFNLRDSPGSSGQGVGSRSYLDWFRLRMNLYGQRNRTTEVNVKLVTLDEKVFDINPTAGVSVPVTLEAQGFWKKLIRPYMSNPIAGSSSVNQHYMKTLASKKYMIDPTTTIENDTDPNIKTIDWFHRIGEVLRYQHKGNDMTAAVMQDGAQSTVNALSDGFSTTPISAKQNKWVLIYASNFSPLTQAAWDALTATEKGNFAATFDMNLEVCHKILDAW